MGGGGAAAVVRPGSLVELWRVVEACARHRAIVIMQAANTGLTGGSTPDGDDYDAPVVVVSTRRIDAIRTLDGGRQVVCLPGSTLHRLQAILKPLGREPHSVLGSSCIGASVVGGVCNGSGGALVRRGPAFTRLALFARLDADGVLQLVNHLGIELGDDPEEMLGRLERGAFRPDDVSSAPAGWASDPEYGDHVRDVGKETPARFNADPRRLFEASGSAGRVVVFAVRLDTFPAAGPAITFCVGTNDPDALQDLRRHLLSTPGALPISAEYIHRDAFDLADAYGKDTVLAIRHLGTRNLPWLFAARSRLDAAAASLGLPKDVGARLLQGAAKLFGDHLPERLRELRRRFEHMLLLQVDEAAAGATDDVLRRAFGSGAGDHFRCDAAEAESAFQHRFAVAGAAVRYREIHRDEVADILALDVALPRSAVAWTETLPDEAAAHIAHRLYYGHFLCHVFHQDYVLRRGADAEAVERSILASLDARGARYPAEHNVGHHYHADPGVEAFHRDLDPRNRFNPGIGRTARGIDWTSGGT